MAKELGDLLDEMIDLKRLRFEGETGLKNLNTVAQILGYKQSPWANGSPLEEFLCDNSGAIEAILEWIKAQNFREWVESIESELPENSGEDEDEDDDEDLSDIVDEFSDEDSINAKEEKEDE